jgi:hypothetical protein
VRTRRPVFATLRRRGAPSSVTCSKAGPDPSGRGPPHVSVDETSPVPDEGRAVGYFGTRGSSMDCTVETTRETGERRRDLRKPQETMWECAIRSWRAPTRTSSATTGRRSVRVPQSAVTRIFPGSETIWQGLCGRWGRSGRRSACSGPRSTLGTITVALVWPPFVERQSGTQRPVRGWTCRWRPRVLRSGGGAGRRR